MISKLQKIYCGKKIHGGLIMAPQERPARAPKELLQVEQGARHNNYTL